MPDGDNTRLGDQDEDDLFPPQVMPDDDEIPSEDHEAVEYTQPYCKLCFSEIFLFRKTGHILLFNKRK